MTRPDATVGGGDLDTLLVRPRRDDVPDDDTHTILRDLGAALLEQFEGWKPVVPQYTVHVRRRPIPRLRLIHDDDLPTSAPQGERGAEAGRAAADDDHVGVGVDVASGVVHGYIVERGA